jgi:hypothetical protein
MKQTAPRLQAAVLLRSLPYLIGEFGIDQIDNNCPQS